MLRVFLFISFVIVGSLHAAAATIGQRLNKEGAIPFEDITFFLQPHEEAGTHCKFTKLEASHDYIVYCGSYEFSVHFLARPYRQPTQEAFEVLMMVNENTNNKTTEASSVSVWVKNSKGSETQNMLVSLGVLKETASLEVRVTFR